MMAVILAEEGIDPGIDCSALGMSSRRNCLRSRSHSPSYSRDFDSEIRTSGGLPVQGRHPETPRAGPEAKGRWKGACFVFDERIALGHGLADQTVKAAGGDDD